MFTPTQWVCLVHQSHKYSPYVTVHIECVGGVCGWCVWVVCGYVGGYVGGSVCVCVAGWVVGVWVGECVGR